MTDDQTYLSTVGLIYEATVSAQRWSSVVDRLAEAAGGHGGMLIVSDALQRDLQIAVMSSHYTSEAARVYVASKLSTDECRWLRELDAAAAGTILRDVEVWPDRERYAAMPSVRWLAKQGVFHRCAVRLCAHGGWRDLFAVMYASDREGIDAREAGRLRRYLPHLARALELRRPFALLERRYGAVFSMLDRLGIGVVLLRGDGEVVLLNEEARRIVDVDDGIGRDRTMKLRIRDSGAAAALRRRMALDRCSDPAGLGMSSPALSVPRCSAREPYQCDTVPLTAPEVALAGTACTLLTVIDPERRARSSVEGLIACYGLTGAEAEVCRLIADGFQAREIADQRRVGLSTVKTQTRAIFSKTRTRNRAELVRRAITLVPPLD